MNFTQKQLTKAKAAKSTEELLTLAKETGVELTVEEAAKYFAELHNEGELADEELDNVAGGCGGSGGIPAPKYGKGRRVRYLAPGGNEYFGTIESSYYVEYQKDYYYWVLLDNGEKMKFPLESEYCPAKVID